MKISILVKTNAKQDSITRLEDGSYKVNVKSLPIDGKANENVIRILAKHFSVPKKQIQILRGHNNKHKLIEILLV